VHGPGGRYNAAMRQKLSGLIPAVFTPMREDTTLDLAKVPAVVEHLLRTGVCGMYVCGSTGEGPSLSSDERRAVAQAYVEAAAGRLPAIVQVGHDSVAEACDLAAHAKHIGAQAVSAMPPRYYGFSGVDSLIDCLARIASAADLPFYYYHIPILSGVSLDVIDFLRRAADRIPNFAGLKYTACGLDEYQGCLEQAEGRFDVLFGHDEMLIAALAAGGVGAVGSTYNFAAPLYLRLWEAFDRGDLVEARRQQSLSQRMIRTMCRYRGQPAFKAAMRLIGVDCGPNRLPMKTLTTHELDELESELRGIGFFDWALSR